MVKESACNVGDPGCPWIGKAAWSIHFSIPAWEIPWTDEPGGLPSMGSHRVRHD